MPLTSLKTVTNIRQQNAPKSIPPGPSRTYRMQITPIFLSNWLKAVKRLKPLCVSILTMTGKHGRRQLSRQMQLQTLTGIYTYRTAIVHKKRE